MSANIGATAKAISDMEQRFRSITLGSATIEDRKRTEKNPHAVALGRIGGLKGGKARAEKLSPEKRREIALKAASARWHKPK